MSVKFTDVVSKTDWIKMTVLLIISAICWSWIWVEYKKPIIPPEWEQEFVLEEIN